jgi:hypothetical protein
MVEIIRLRGNEISVPHIKDSHYRRATQYKNKILFSLRKFGLTEDDCEIDVIRAAMKRERAFATWYVEGYMLHYSYDKCATFAQNMFVVAKLIELEVQKVLDETKTYDEFIREFSEEDDMEEQRVEAREILGVDSDEKDFSKIDKAYKKLSKVHHPDLGGDVDEFKEINRAHKILRRELC